MGARGERMQANILAVLAGHSEPLSAYDLLSALRPKNPKLAPPTIYRALAALDKRGLVHRLESRNAYVASKCEHDDRSTVFLICDDCGAVEESAAPEVFKDLSNVTKKSGFVANRHVVEVLGVCGNCAGSESDT